MLGVLFPMIRATRDLSGPDRTSFGAFIEGYASLDNPFVASVSEIGGTMATVAYTYALVPASKPFEDGLGYLYALTTVLPNLFWTIHPAIAYGTASDWLIQTVDPVGAAHQVGLGYSCIAETYLNFGWFGVTVAMTLIGFALAKLKTLAVHGTRRHVALVAVFTAFVLRFPRDESGSLVRAFVWYSWLPFAAVTVFAAIANRRAATKGMASRVPLTAEAAARIPTRTANVNVVDHAPGI
jgi:hypothetical protein